MVEWRRRRVLQFEIVGGHPVAEKQEMTIKHKHTSDGYMMGREEKRTMVRSDILILPSPSAIISKKICSLFC